MESTMLTKTRFTSFYSFSTNYVLKRFLYLLIPLFLLSNVDVNAQCTGVITGQTGSMNVSLNALGTATVQVGTHVAGFGFPANSITGTIGISAPTCVTPTYQVYEKNGANLGPLVANGSAATIAFNCSDLGANTYYFLYDNNGSPLDDNKFEFTINIIDDLPPTVTCPANKVLTSPTCNLSVSGLGATITDNCSAPASITTTYTITGSTVASGSGNLTSRTFNTGLSTVTYTSIDAEGNQQSCSFTVKVNELVPVGPTGTCPPALAVGGIYSTSTDPNSCAKVINSGLAISYTDNCSPSLTYTLSITGATTFGTSGNSGNIINGVSFLRGTSNVSFTVSDNAGGISTCTFQVVVADNIPPTVTCPGNLVVNAKNFNTCNALVVNSGGSNFPAGDIGRDALAHNSFDNCIATNTLNNNSNTTWTLSGATTGSGTGNGSFAGSTWVGSTFNIGTTIVTYTVRDGAIGGNTATCSFTVQVTDLTGPIFNTPCPVSPIIGAPVTSTCSGIVSNVYAPSLSDCTLPANLTYTITGATTASGNGNANNLTYNVGTNYVTYTATDAVGNTSVCDFQVKLRSSTPTNLAVGSGVPNTFMFTRPNTCDTTYTAVLPTYSGGCASAQKMEYRIVDASNTQIVSWTSVSNLTTVNLPKGVNMIFYRVIDSTNATPTVIEGCNVAGGIYAVLPYNQCPGAPVAPVISGANWSSDSRFQTRVTVLDDTQPIVNCPTNKVTILSAGSDCIMPVVGLSPSISDNCPGPDSLRVSISGAGVDAGNGPAGFSTGTFYSIQDSYAGGNVKPIAGNGNFASGLYGLGADGWYFNRGVSTVTYTVSDVAFNTSTCSFTVTVLDNQPPTIICPNSFTAVMTNPATCQGLINPTPTIRDIGACLGASDVITLRYQITGVTTLDQTVTTTYVGNLPGLPVTGVYTNNTFSTLLNKGVSNVLCTATDVSGNTATCSFNVTLNDNTAPVFSYCPTSAVYYTDAAVCTRALTLSEQLTGTPVASDNCGPFTLGYVMTGATIGTGSTTPTSFNRGTTTVTYTANDGTLTSNCVYTVQVLDSIRPAITCPANQVFNLLAGATTCTATGSLPVPIASDNCTPAPTLSYQVNGGGFVAGSLTSLAVTGSSTVEYRATDASANTKSCAFTITVVDLAPPTITYLGADVTFTANSLTCEANYTWIEPSLAIYAGHPAPDATDNCGGAVTIQRTYFSGPNPNIITGLLPYGQNNVPPFNIANTSFQLGVHIIRYIFTDNVGNSAFRDVKVTIVPASAATLACPANVVITTAVGNCNQSYTIADPISNSNCTSSTWGASFAGNANGNPANFTGLADGTNSNPLTFQKGTTTVTLSSLNTVTNVTATCSFTVTVNDNIAPTLACPSNVVLNTTTNGCTQTSVISDPVSDNCTGSTWSATFSGNSNGNPANVANVADGINTAAITFQRGTTNVALSATDASGNPAATCSFSVTVNDNIAPVLSAVPASVTITCSQTVPAAATLTATDNCSGASVNLVTTTNTVGCSVITTRTWTASDASGNTATGVQTVTQVDNQAPTFGAAPTTVSSVGCGTSVSLNLASFISDNGCTGVVNVSNTRTGATADASGVYPNGNTTVVFTATDACGNSRTHSVVVTVNGSISAVVTTVNASNNIASDGSATANVTGGNGINTYQWNNGSITQTASNLLPGTYTVTVTSGGCTAVASGVVSSNLNCSGYSVAITTTPSNAAGTAGGSATATPSGSVAPYSFIWSTGSTAASINNLAAGTYTVTVSSSVGCVSINTAIVPTGSANNVQFALGAVSGNPGDVVNIPVTVSNFTNVEAFTMAFTLADAAVAKFTGNVSGFAIPSNTIGDFFKANDGKLSVVFSSGSPISLANGTLLFNLQVQLVGTAGQNTASSITGGTPPLEVIVSGLTMVPSVTGSTVTINGFGNLTLSGTYVREDLVTIGNVTTGLTNAGPASSVNSGGTNAYSFAVSTGSNPTVTPTKNNNVGFGINSADLVAIQKHILTSQLITSPYKRIAADINKSNSITSLDLVELKQLLLGQITSFSANTSWRFVDRAAVIALTPNFVAVPFSESKSYVNVVSNITNANFIGIKIGDIDLAPGPINFDNDEATDRGNSEYNFLTADQTFEVGDEVKVAVHASDYAKITGLQGTFKFDPAKLQLKDIEVAKVAGLSKESFNTAMAKDGLLPMVWFDYQALQLADDADLITLVFKANRAGKLSESLEMTSDVTNALAMTASNEAKNLSLQFTNEVANVFGLNQNRPNPFVSNTLISFTLPTAGAATLKVVDISGKTVKVVNGIFGKGYNEIMINRSDLPSNGIYYYQLESAGLTAQRKMIIVE